MPYISQDHRQTLDPLIDKLALQIVQEAEAMGYDGAFAGLLNYTCTRLALKVVATVEQQNIRTVFGAFTLDQCERLRQAGRFGLVGLEVVGEKGAVRVGRFDYGDCHRLVAVGTFGVR